MRRTLTFSTLLGLLLMFGCTGADNTNTVSDVRNVNGAANGNNKSATNAALTDADRKFMTNAAQGGMAEVELGRLATERASSPAVKQFGQRMVDDHSKANDELKQLAARNNVSLPNEVNSEQKEMKDKLSKLSGAAFDREYMKGMVEDHEKDVREFQEQTEKASGADVKAFASKTLPVLQQHLQLARETNKKVNP